MNRDHEAPPRDDLAFSINAANQRNTPLLTDHAQSQGYSLSFTNATSHIESSSVRSSIFSSKARCIKKWRFSPKSFTLQITLFQTLIYLIISYLSPNEDANSCVVYRLGAKYTPAILAYHHFHRLILPIFLHFNLQHLLGNVFFQLMWGFRIEQSLGTKKFVFLYFVAGIGGNLLSTVNELFIISAGASSSILGILGFGFPYVILTWKDPKNDTLDHFFSIFTYIGTLKALVIGAEDSDNSAHRGIFFEKNNRKNNHIF